jgi:hypothetical protein
MDRRRLRFRAEVDWIEVEVQTARPTNFVAIQRALKDFFGDDGTRYVHSLDKGDGGAASQFRFRLHDPSSFAIVGAVAQHLDGRFGLIRSPKISGIEVAVDAYGANPALAAHFYKFAARLVGPNRRIYRDYKGSARSIPANIAALTRLMSEGWQIGIANADADEYQHIYWKTTDGNGKALQPQVHRARTEIRLRGAALPCQTFDGWQNYDFAGLAEYFRFRMLKDDLDPLLAATAAAAEQIGQRRVRNRMEGGTRLYSKATKADSALNARARDALRELSRRWRAPATGLNCYANDRGAGSAA